MVRILTTIAVWISILLVFGMALLQLSLTLGAPLGEYVLGGMHKILPARMRFISGFFSCFFTIVGLSYLQKTGKISTILNAKFADVLLIIYTLFLAYAIIGNGIITKSKKEKYIMTPLSLIGCISSIILLINY